MSSFKDLAAWQESIQLAAAVYRITAHFPENERQGISHQLRKAAVSVASNIAEGNGRYSPADTLRFLYISRGSLNELETQLIISCRIGYLEASRLDEICGKIVNCGRLLNGLISYLRKNRK
jgi:four helix bundle protein